jgi:hypothetical protein
MFVCPNFIYFLSDFGTFGTKYVHQTVLSYCEFHADRRGESRTLLGDINLSVFPSCISDLNEIRYCRCTRNAFVNLWASQKSAQGKLRFSYGLK